MSRNRIVFGLVLVLLLFFWFTRLENSAVLATQADEGVHVTVADLVSTGSRRIYADLFENRTPGAEWLLSAWFWLTGPSIFAARVLAIMMMTVTCALLFALAKVTTLIVGTSSELAMTAGLGATILFALDPLALFWSRFTMLEHFSSIGAVAAVLVASIALYRRSRAYWFVSGLLCAVTIVSKQTELVLLAAFVALFGVRAITIGGRRSFRAASSWTAGLLLVTGLFLVTLALQGALQPFILFATNAGELAPLAHVASKLSEITVWLLRTPGLWLSVPALAGAVWLRRSTLQLIMLWFAAETAFLFLPPHLDLRPGGFSHYALSVSTAATVLSASGTAIMWKALEKRQVARRVTTLLVALAIVLLLPGWYGEYRTNLTGTDYPPSSVQQEQEIGKAAALVSAPDRSLLVLGNAVFYHRAQRTPAARFFHWPEYLAQSDLAPLAIESTTSALASAETAAVLVSRLHLEERLPPEVLAPLRQSWIPATLLPYPYQRDVILYVRRPLPPDDDVALATFGGRLTLLALDAQWLDDGNLLVSLWWRANRSLEVSYTVFVHLLSEQQVILAQNDAIPVTGFRPTTTWQEGEAVLDYHWIEVPHGTELRDVQLNVGMYESTSGERLQREYGGTPRDAFRRPLEPSP